MLELEEDRIEIVACEVCEAKYNHKIIMFDGKELFGESEKICGDCSNIREKEYLLEREQAQEERRIKKAQVYYERVVPPSYRSTDTNDPRFNQKLLTRCEVWLKAVYDKNAIVWLGLVGETGRCKTRCIALLAKRMIMSGYNLEWVIATRFQWAVQRQWGESDDAREAVQLLKKWRNVEILIFDDLGKQKMSEAVESAFFDLIEHRSSQNKLIIWSANTHPKDMMTSNDFSKDRGAPIIGRLLDFSEIVNV